MEQFDVFLAHNSLDKPEVKLVAAALKRRNLKPWIDDEQILPGKLFQDEIQQTIPLVKSAAIFFGVRGLGRWQSWELRSLINQCVKRNIPVIPVLLPGVNQLPENLIFFEEFRWVCFSQSIDDESVLSLLVSGITGIKPQPTNIQNQPHQADDLYSEKGIKYTRLRDLLAAKNWREADKETYLVMIRVVGKEYGDYFTSDELLNFPCTDLRTIDKLWVKYSNGQYGFSVQKKIWLEVGKNKNAFYTRVAWQVSAKWYLGGRLKRESIIYDGKAPVGHLPFECIFGRYGFGEGGWYGFQETGFRLGLRTIFSRIETCEL